MRTTDLWAALSGLRAPAGLQKLSLVLDIRPDFRPHVAAVVPSPARPWLFAAPLRGCSALTVLEVRVSGRGWPSTGYGDVLHLALGAPAARLERLYVERLEPPSLELDYGGGDDDGDSSDDPDPGLDDDPDPGLDDGFGSAAVSAFSQRFPCTQLHLARRL